MQKIRKLACGGGKWWRKSKSITQQIGFCLPAVHTHNTFYVYGERRSKTLYYVKFILLWKIFRQKQHNEEEREREKVGGLLRHQKHAGCYAVHKSMSRSKRTIKRIHKNVSIMILIIQLRLLYSLSLLCASQNVLRAFLDDVAKFWHFYFQMLCISIAIELELLFMWFFLLSLCLLIELYVFAFRVWFYEIT